MKLTVVIVNYNVRYFLEQCLLSVERALAGVKGEVIVVDNCSSDDSLEFLKPKFPWVQYIENKENVGFSRANNQAIKKARGEYVLLLNPDTIIGEDTLRECVDFMDCHSDAGACGVFMERADGSFAPESRRGVPTMFTSFCKMTGLCSMFPHSRRFGRYYMQFLDNREVNEIDIVSGAFMFIRKAVLDKVGLLDETFFMYGEDIDLSYRILLAGYKNYYLPTPILHYKGESTKKPSIKYVNVFHQAMIIFFRKHFSHNNFLLEMVLNTAVCMKGIMAYVHLKTMDFYYSMCPERKERCLLVGYGENLKDMEEIAKRNDVEYELYYSSDGTLPAKEVLNQNYNFIVFDIDRFLFSSILEFFRHYDSKVLPTNIGTYLRDSKAILHLHGVMV